MNGEVGAARVELAHIQIKSLGHYHLCYTPKASAGGGIWYSLGTNLKLPYTILCGWGLAPSRSFAASGQTDHVREDVNSAETYFSSGVTSNLSMRKE
jgi:hypothetical protein